MTTQIASGGNALNDAELRIYTTSGRYLGTVTTSMKQSLVETMEAMPSGIHARMLGKEAMQTLHLKSSDRIIIEG